MYLAITAHETQQICLETSIANPQIALLKLQHTSRIAGTHWARRLLHHTLIVNTAMARLERRQMNFVMSIQCIVAVLLLIFAIKNAWCWKQPEGVQLCSSKRLQEQDKLDVCFCSQLQQLQAATHVNEKRRLQTDGCNSRFYKNACTQNKYPAYCHQVGNVMRCRHIVWCHCCIAIVVLHLTCACQPDPYNVCSMQLPWWLPSLWYCLELVPASTTSVQTMDT